MMRTSLVLLVAVIVVLITALVVLAIFGGGIGNISPFIDPKFACINSCQFSCKTSNQLPPGWATTQVKGQETCADLVTDVANGCGCTMEVVTKPGT
jgi:hypothetical protein